MYIQSTSVCFISVQYYGVHLHTIQCHCTIVIVLQSLMVRYRSTVLVSVIWLYRKVHGANMGPTWVVTALDLLMCIFVELPCTLDWELLYHGNCKASGAWIWKLWSYQLIEAQWRIYALTHICVGNLTIIGSDNGLSPYRRQAIIWTNAGIVLIGPLILIKIHTFSFKKSNFKLLSAKSQPFCLGSNVLTLTWIRWIIFIHWVPLNWIIINLDNASSHCLQTLMLRLLSHYLYRNANKI